jgi:hypothetical protein
MKFKLSLLCFSYIRTSSIVAEGVRLVTVYSNTIFSLKKNLRSLT